MPASYASGCIYLKAVDKVGGANDGKASSPP